MKLQELLEELQENLLRDVSPEAETPVSNLWSQRQLVRYLDDAQNKMARETECLLDSQNPRTTTFNLVEGIDTYYLDPRVVRVYHVMVGNRILKQSSLYHELDGSEQRRSSLPQEAFQTDRVSWYSLDTDTQALRVYPVPTEKENLEMVRLSVSRLPMEPLATDNLEAEPEIPRDFHLDMVEWAAFRALRNHDVDGENLQKANVHRSAFRQATDDLRRATRRRHAPPAMFGGQVNN